MRFTVTAGGAAGAPQSQARQHGRASSPPPSPAARCGILEFERKERASLATPALVSITEAGHPTYLTLDLMELLKEADGIGLSALHISYADASGRPCPEASLCLPESVAIFVSQKMLLGRPNALGGGEKYALVNMSRGNHCKVTPEEYARAAAGVHADVLLSLDDELECMEGCIPSENRLRKAASRRASWLADCSRVASESGMKVLAQVSVISPLAIPEREHTGEGLSGYVLSGSAAAQVDEEIQANYARCTARLPANLPRSVQISGRPLEVVECVAAGIDLVHSGWPHMLTEVGLAFCGPISPPEDDAGVVGRPRKRREKMEDNREMPSGHIPGGVADAVVLNLWDPVFARDMRPILPGCDCPTCADHSRAYLHHLFRANELLAPVLVNMHNLYRYLQFFHSMRQSIAEGWFDGYRQWAAEVFASL
jgi:queuine tRNA-ribosyltransferase subunit QTRTD1